MDYSKLPSDWTQAAGAQDINSTLPYSDYGLLVDGQVWDSPASWASAITFPSPTDNVKVTAAPQRDLTWSLTCPTSHQASTSQPPVHGYEFRIIQASAGPSSKAQLASVKESRLARRRAQNRHAQQAYRARKQSQLQQTADRCKQLEAELNVYRGFNEQLKVEIRNMHVMYKRRQSCCSSTSFTSSISSDSDGSRSDTIDYDAAVARCDASTEALAQYCVS